MWPPDEGGMPRRPMRCAICNGENYTHREGCPNEFPVHRPPPVPATQHEPLLDLARSTAAAILRRIARAIEPKADLDKPL